jgi:transposase
MRTKVNDNSFNGQSFFVGIDCHKKNWKVTILGENFEHKTISQDPNPEVLASYLMRKFPGGNYKAVYEAGFQGFNAARELRQHGVDCIVIHPADVPSSNKEKLQKTDKTDSRKLAKMLRGQSLEGIHIPEQKLEADRALARHRFKVSKDLSRYKNKVKSLLFQFDIRIPERFTDGQTREWTKSFTKWLKELTFDYPTLKLTLDFYIETAEFLRKQKQQIDKELRKLGNSEEYREEYQNLISIPGIGPTAAITFLLQIGDIRRFQNMDKLCSYVGLMPSMYGSGDRLVTGKMIKRGKKEFKITLIEASWIAVRKDPALMASFNKLKKRMAKNKAIIRIARKLLTRMRYILLNNQKYELGLVA